MHPRIRCGRAFMLFAILSTSSATFTYGTVMAQDPLPPCETAVRCNGEFCADICVDGTVQIDPWLYNSVRFQYDLVKDRSFKYGPIIGTHNAFIARSNGFGLTEDLAASLYSRTASAASTHVRIPNQRYGPTTLLDFGVRELEFDIWDISWDGLKTFDVYMCHSPVPDPTAVLDLQAAADALSMGELTYNPFLELCSNHTLVWAMSSVKAWMDAPANVEQVVAMFLDNRVFSLNIDLVTQSIASVFSNHELMTPSDLATLFNGTFPSRTQMLAAGKRGYCESNSYVGNNYANTSLSELCFYPTTWATAQLDAVGMSPFPNCTYDSSAAGKDWYGTAFTRVLDGGDLAWDPASEDEHLIQKPNGVADLVNCGYNNVGLADLNPTALQGWVWSWAAGQPASAPAAPCRAAAMTLVRGGWTAQVCTATFPAVCRLGDNTLPAGDKPALWNLTAAVAWADAPAACAALGPGWAFDVPRDGRENQLIASTAAFNGLWRAQAVPGIWLNVKV